MCRGIDLEAVAHAGTPCCSFKTHILPIVCPHLLASHEILNFGMRINGKRIFIVVSGQYVRKLSIEHCK